MEEKNSKEIETVLELPDIERRCAQLICLGMAQNKIAEILGVTESTVSVWKAGEQFSQYLLELRRDSHAAFRVAQVDLMKMAVATFMDILVSGEPDLRVKVASLIYQRGLPPIEANHSGMISASIVDVVRALREAQ